MPTEQTLRAKPLKQHTVGKIVVWFDEENDTFLYTETESGYTNELTSYSELCDFDDVLNA